MARSAVQNAGLTSSYSEILADSRDWLSEKFGVKKKAGPGNSPEPVRVSN